MKLRCLGVIWILILIFMIGSVCSVIGSEAETPDTIGIDCPDNIGTGADLRNCDLSEANLEAVDLSGANFRGANLSGANLRNANLTRAGLANANLSKAKLSDANLNGAYMVSVDLSGADLTSAILKNVNLTYANVIGANLKAAVFESKVDLSGVDLSGVDLSEKDLQGVNFESANLSTADLKGANLQSVNLNQTNLLDADLSGANLRDSDLRGKNLKFANLTGANLKDARLSGLDLSNSNFRNFNLQGVNLNDANLSGANLQSTDLRGAYLIDANLSGANLSSASLRAATIRNADLTNTNLAGADLTAAMLIGANMTGADLTGATLKRVKWGETTLPDGSTKGESAGVPGETSNIGKVFGGLLVILIAIYCLYREIWTWPGRGKVEWKEDEVQSIIYSSNRMFFSTILSFLALIFLKLVISPIIGPFGAHYILIPTLGCLVYLLYGVQFFKMSFKKVEPILKSRYVTLFFLSLLMFEPIWQLSAVWSTYINPSVAGNFFRVFFVFTPLKILIILLSAAILLVFRGKEKTGFTVAGFRYLGVAITFTLFSAFLGFTFG